ncbi:GNAT family N-acetyltransferase [Tabrizicola sp.]|uniref:GNAT family N-acetyltransferase n=1 Tax=Tabrizicola sp. TaxID=2005166 RepID=UPI00273715B1|nr:GNAT family protein [Tabrizicola sp.]MDP3194492.1 GNAT family protein [Tabrizicola sp.]
MLRPATLADVPFIRGIASQPDNAPFITDEDDAALSVYLTDPSARLLIWEVQRLPLGFALFCQVGEPSGAVELRRLALAGTGRGQGQRFLRLLLDYGFGTLGAARVWLDASSENPRAMKTYDRAGFTLEGRLRQHWHRPALGRVVDLMIYGMLRGEWETLEPLPAQA